MKTVIFRKPPSVQELRKKSGEDDMSGTAAKPFTVMQVTDPVGSSLCRGGRIAQAAAAASRGCNRTRTTAMSIYCL